MRRHKLSRLFPFLAALWAAGPFGLSASAQRESAPGGIVVPIDPARALYAPTQLVFSPAHGLIAMATDGSTRQLVLYRAGNSGSVWRRWAELPLSAAHGDADLVVAGDRVLVFGARGEKILVAQLAFATATDAGVTAAAAVRVDTLLAGAPVLSLTADVSPPDSARQIVAHLAWLARPAGAAERVILYRRSPDGGASWSEPDTLARGDVEGPALFARAEAGNLVDLCFRRAAMMAWRGSGSRGRSWVAERGIHLAAAPGSHNAVARLDSQVFVLCENDLHQVAGATSLNHGYNWGRAIAVARQGRHVRMPALDCGGGLFWVAYSAADSLVVLRSTDRTSYPKQWSPGINVAEVCTQGPPDVVALPDRTAGLIYGAPDGRLYFARVRQPARR